jgi:hypothetical protein
MISGYVLRNGQDGTDNLPVTGRTTIPQWAVRLYGVSSNQPARHSRASTRNGCYMEDNDYLGDLDQLRNTGTNYQQGVDFDLDEYNGRWCVTPEFPDGTYAYFVAINSNGTPVFPYNIGRGFYGSPVGGSVSAISETVVTNFLGNTNLDFHAQHARRERRNGHPDVERDRRRHLHGAIHREFFNVDDQFNNRCRRVGHGKLHRQSHEQLSFLSRCPHVRCKL